MGLGKENLYGCLDVSDYLYSDWTLELKNLFAETRGLGSQDPLSEFFRSNSRATLLERKICEEFPILSGKYDFLFPNSGQRLLCNLEGVKRVPCASSIERAFRVYVVIPRPGKGQLARLFVEDFMTSRYRIADDPTIQPTIRSSLEDVLMTC